MAWFVVARGRGEGHASRHGGIPPSYSGGVRACMRSQVFELQRMQWLAREKLATKVGMHGSASLVAPGMPRGSTLSRIA